MNVFNLLTRHASARPTAKAVVDVRRDTCLTFEQLYRHASQAADRLDRAGLHPGDAVLVVLPMSADLYVALCATLIRGLAAIVPEHGLDAETLAAISRAGPIRAVISDPRLLSAMPTALLDLIPYRFVMAESGGSSAVTVLVDKDAPGTSVSRSLWEAVDLPGSAPALISFTSGTGGSPKIAMRTHAMLEAQHRALEEILRLQSGEVDLTVLPIYLLADLATGLTSVIPDLGGKPVDELAPDALVEQCRTHAVTRLTLSPAAALRLTEYGTEASVVLRDISAIVLGGAPVFPALTRRLANVVPRARVTTIYGATEAEPISFVSHDEVRRGDHEVVGLGSGLLVGFPFRSTLVRILPDQWGTPIHPLTPDQFDVLCLTPPRIGEIVVRGAHVLTGYVGGQGDLETKVRVGTEIWHRTGDAGYFDAWGRLWLVGRCEGRVRDDRGDLYPLSVEAAAALNVRVRRSALTEVNNRRILLVEWVEGIEAATAASEGDALKRSLNWAHLDRIIPVDRLPTDRRHRSKIDYPSLRRLAASLLE